MTTTTAAAAVETAVADYIAAWNATDAAHRRALVARAFADDATYVDPLMTGEGAERIDAMIAAAQAQYPGHRFTLASGPDVHHDRVRFTWTLTGPDGSPVAIGLDVATIAPDGRLRDVTGFLDAPGA
ncbi:MAG TPA: nuclear transport factor 2 family protein [Capillimicrobium sp.]|nr:nuclear transport factor 2 family protein [Capillimicrobium sp.]